VADGPVRPVADPVGAVGAVGAVGVGGGVGLRRERDRAGRVVDDGRAAGARSAWTAARRKERNNDIAAPYWARRCSARRPDGRTGGAA
jgi:hypothetical protein